MNASKRPIVSVLKSKFHILMILTLPVLITVSFWPLLYHLILIIYMRILFHKLCWKLQIFIVQYNMSNPKDIVSYLVFFIRWPLIVLETIRYINHRLSVYCPWNDSFCQAWNDWMRASIVITLPLFYSQISLYCVGSFHW